ncbi:MAG: DUF4956 domain-containing protein [Acutalibacteraceae bacterium]|nr:DUF4956 domain-containing protein [Clostridia bacterium]MEE1299702.1 DUF4956 domain-containing protein [Acutalibacteraceae bacterium]MBQ1549684.1 DUF4956 domain-containing protein [Clostridia bacterium]MBQ2437660.1 DUF4956 domain-containing protein [Clostridia bacterium]MBQ3995920.1 DUF4956 domain-containing protein [Clostridia bacterium]
MLDSITYSDKVFSMSIPMFLASIFLALALGIGTALVFQFRTKHTASMATTLAIMPPAIALVIMLVNGNIGAGVAVAGAFALVRFRSLPGTAKEIAAIFVAMAVGLACGMTQLLLAVIFFAIMSVTVIVLTLIGFGDKSAKMRQLRVTIPEDLDYYELFDDLMEKYTKEWELSRVKTTNMGTLYELWFDVLLKDEKQAKEFMDAIRCRNGNLRVMMGRIADKPTL